MDRWARLRVQETVEAEERALAHLERAGESGARLRRMIGSRLGTGYQAGPMPVDEALEHIRALRAHEHGLLAAAWSSVDNARLHAMRGDVGRARELWSEGRQVYVDAGLTHDRRDVRPGWSRDRLPGRRLPRRGGGLRESSRSSKGSATVASTPPRLSGSWSAGTAQERRTVEELRGTPARPPLPTIASLPGSHGAGCSTHAAANTSRPSRAHVKRWRSPKQGTSTTHARSPVRTSPRSWRCPVGPVRRRTWRPRRSRSSRRRAMLPAGHSFARVSRRSASRAPDRLRPALPGHRPREFPVEP